MSKKKPPQQGNAKPPQAGAKPRRSDSSENNPALLPQPKSANNLKHVLVTNGNTSLGVPFCHSSLNTLNSCRTGCGA